MKPDTYSVGKYDVAVSRIPLGVKIEYVLNDLEDKIKLKESFFEFLENLEDELFEGVCTEISLQKGNSFLHNLSKKFEHLEENSYTDLEEGVEYFRTILREIVLNKVSKWFNEYNIKPSEL